MRSAIWRGLAPGDANARIGGGVAVGNDSSSSMTGSTTGPIQSHRTYNAHERKYAGATTADDRAFLQQRQRLQHGERRAVLAT